MPSGVYGNREVGRQAFGGARRNGDFSSEKINYTTLSRLFRFILEGTSSENPTVNAK
jgi:hypothetical protein